MSTRLLRQTALIQGQINRCDQLYKECMNDAQMADNGNDDRARARAYNQEARDWRDIMKVVSDQEAK